MVEPQSEGTGSGKFAALAMTEHTAVAIFVAKHGHKERDSVANQLALQYCITSKSVRGEL